MAGDAAHEAEIAQDAYLKIWEHWPTVGAMEDPTGYLHRTAWNLWRSRGRPAGAIVRFESSTCRFPQHPSVPVRRDAKCYADRPKRVANKQGGPLAAKE